MERGKWSDFQLSSCWCFLSKNCNYNIFCHDSAMTCFNDLHGELFVKQTIYQPRHKANALFLFEPLWPQHYMALFTGLLSDTQNYGCASAGNAGNVYPSPQVNDPDMHHGTCVTHVPWCMPGSLTIGFLWNRPRGNTFPAFPAHAQPAILRIW